MRNNIMKFIESIVTRETISYVIFGFMTTAISILIYGLCRQSFGLGLVVSNTISTVIAVIFAFFTNKIFVFKSRNFTFKHTMTELIKFSGGRFLTYWIDTILLLVLEKGLLVDEMLSKYITQVVIIILNYLISKKAVFKKEK